MFNLFKKSIDIIAPFDGKTIDITEVKDPVFAQLMMGDGMAIIPSSEDIYAPVEGTIEVIAESNHSVCIKSKQGLELIIHYGIDTVKYHGQGFEMKVKLGQTVKPGDLLYHCNSQFFIDNKIDLTSPVLVLNGDKFKIINKQLNKTIKKGEVLFTVVKK